MKREKLTDNFYRDEFTCKCGCGLVAINLYLVECLQKIRDDLLLPMTIVSGYRCPPWNKHEGGDRYSRHKLGLAADIWIVRPPSELAELIEIIFQHEPIGLGIGENFVHFDVLRARNKRWVY